MLPAKKKRSQFENKRKTWKRNEKLGNKKQESIFLKKKTKLFWIREQEKYMNITFALSFLKVGDKKNCNHVEAFFYGGRRAEAWGPTPMNIRIMSDKKNHTHNDPNHKTIICSVNIILVFFVILDCLHLFPYLSVAMPSPSRTRTLSLGSGGEGGGRGGAPGEMVKKITRCNVKIILKAAKTTNMFGSQSFGYYWILVCCALHSLQSRKEGERRHRAKRWERLNRWKRFSRGSLVSHWCQRGITTLLATRGTLQQIRLMDQGSTMLTLWMTLTSFWRTLVHIHVVALAGLAF